MVDTHLDLPRNAGRFYLCPMCVRQAAHAHGYTAPDDMEQLKAEWAAAVEQRDRSIEELAARLEEAEANRVVPLADVARAVRQSIERQPEPTAA